MPTYTKVHTHSLMHLQVSAHTSWHIESVHTSCPRIELSPPTSTCVFSSAYSLPHNMPMLICLHLHKCTPYLHPLHAYAHTPMHACTPCIHTLFHVHNPAGILVCLPLTRADTVIMVLFLEAWPKDCSVDSTILLCPRLDRGHRPRSRHVECLPDLP